MFALPLPDWQLRPTRCRKQRAMRQTAGWLRPGRWPVCANEVDGKSSATPRWEKWKSGRR